MTFVSSSADVPNPVKVRALQKRIGWLCQLGRMLAAAYAAWTLWLTLSFWANGALVAHRFSFLGNVEAAEVSGSIRAVGLGFSLSSWALVAATCYLGWQLFSAYLQGRIFTAGSALMLRRITLFGMAAVLADIVIRPVLVWLVSGTAPDFAKASYYYFSPNDLALLIFLLSLFAIAHIFKVAAELADENAEIL